MKRIYFIRTWNKRVGWRDTLLIHMSIAKVKELSKKMHKLLYIGYIEVQNNEKPSHTLMDCIWPITITQLIVCGETEMLLNNKYKGMLYK